MSDDSQDGKGPPRASEHDAQEGEVQRILCLVPPELPARVCDALGAELEGAQVLVEERWRERRGPEGRRCRGRPIDDERRLVQNADGRRVAERRSSLIPCKGFVLPRSAKRWRDEILVVRRIPVPAERRRDHDDHRLIIRFQSGDGAAFDRLYERYLTQVGTYADMMLGDAHEAEDIAQEVLLEVLSSAPEYEVRGVPLRIWIFRIARNRIRKRIEGRRRTEIEDPMALRDRIDATDSQDEEIARHLADAEFLRLVEFLTEDQRKVVVLRFLLGMELDEIAAHMGISPNAAAALQYRGLRVLRPRLAQRFGEAETAREDFGLSRLLQPVCVTAWHSYAWGAPPARHFSA